MRWPRARAWGAGAAHPDVRCVCARGHVGIHIQAQGPFGAIDFARDLRREGEGPTGASTWGACSYRASRVLVPHCRGRWQVLQHAGRVAIRSCQRGRSPGRPASGWAPPLTLIASL